MDTLIAYLDPLTNRVEAMPVAMMTAYVTDFTGLNLAEAARKASARDYMAAQNLLADVTGDNAVLSIPYPISEGAEFDYPSVEFPTLR